MSIENILKIAAAQNRTTEDPPGSNMQQYGKWYGMNGVAWCAIFISWVFDQAGHRLNIEKDKGFHYCPNGYNHFKRLGKIHNLPEPGDIVFFDFNHDGFSEHVGIVDKIGFNGKFYSWEGNTSKTSNDNGGAVMYRERNINQVLGFARVIEPEKNNNKKHWAYNSYQWGKNNNIITGSTDINTYLNKNISKGEMLTILKNYHDNKDKIK